MRARDDRLWKSYCELVREALVCMRNRHFARIDHALPSPTLLLSCPRLPTVFLPKQSTWFDEVRTSDFKSRKWFVRFRVPGVGEDLTLLGKGSADHGGDVDESQAQKALSPLLYFHGGKPAVSEPSHLQMLYSRLVAVAPSFVIPKTKFVAAVRDALYDVLAGAKSHVQMVASKLALRDSRLPGRGEAAQAWWWGGEGVLPTWGMPPRQSTARFPPPGFAGVHPCQRAHKHTPPHPCMRMHFASLVSLGGHGATLPLLPPSKGMVGAAGLALAGLEGTNTMVDAMHAAMEHVLAPVLAIVTTIADLMMLETPSGLDWRMFLLRLRCARGGRQARGGGGGRGCACVAAGDPLRPLLPRGAGWCSLAFPLGTHRAPYACGCACWRRTFAPAPPRLPSQSPCSAVLSSPRAPALAVPGFFG
jgi:hypothetical protein